MTTRRKFLTASSSVVATVIGGTFFTGWNGKKWTASSNRHSPIAKGELVNLETVVEGFRQPLALENPIENYYYIADKFGQIYLYSNGELQRDPVLDISDQIVMNHGEQGLLGLEFHPDFASNNKLYVRYSSPRRKGTPESYSHTFVLSEFRTTGGYREVVLDSERPILEIPEPGRMHNAGAVEFGPDGYLYVTIGDGGGDGHDGSSPLNHGSSSHAEDWYWTNVGGNGQDVTENLLGSILRIDVNNESQDKPYSIPEENPLVGKEGLDEHYAWGFRNPYSMSFDGDDLYVADAGTRRFEEVNVVKKGGNYGWNVREGLSCHNNLPLLRAPSATGIEFRELPMCPHATPSGQELRDPVIVYPNIPGGVVIGGVICRDSAIPQIEGEYIFGDLTGRLFAANTSSTDELWPVKELFITGPNHSGENKRMNSAPLTITDAREGELFVLTVAGEGSVKRITSP